MYNTSAFSYLRRCATWNDREIKRGNGFESIPNLWCDPQNINPTIHYS